MSWFKHDDNCSVCRERLMEVKAKAEERFSPLGHISTRHEYSTRAWAGDGKGGYGVTPLTVRYSPSDRSVRIGVGEQAVTLKEGQFDELRQVLHAFAFDPEFNGGARERV